MNEPLTHRRAAGVRRRPLTAGLVALGLLGAACSGDGSPATDGNDAATGTTAVLPPCLDPPDGPTVAPEGSSAASGDLVAQASIAPGPTSVLSAITSVRTTEPATVAVTATAGDQRVAVPPTTEPATAVEVPLVGLRAETTYDITVAATTPEGAEETATLTFATGSLPPDLPPLDVTVREPAAMSPGITVFNIRQWEPTVEVGCTQPDPDGVGLLLGVDAEGEVVWYLRSDHEMTDVSTTPRGTLLISVHDVLIREVDVLGRPQRELGTRVATDLSPVDLAGVPYVGPLTEPIDIDSAHHELLELPSGNLLTISTEVIPFEADEVAGLCDGAVDEQGQPVPDPTGVVADVVVELTPEGDEVGRWPLSDVYDPLERQGSDLCVVGNVFAPPNWFYPEGATIRDWTHANAAIVDEATNTLLVSVRHLDAIVALRYRDDADGPAGELLWELGPEGTLDLVSGEHSLHGHAVELQPDGTILYYDNGNGRPGTVVGGGDAPAYSRAVRYRIDPAAGTAEQLWEHRDVGADGLPVAALFLSDADALDNGNVLITHGGVATPDGALSARLVEVVPDWEGGGAADRTVFDLTVGDAATVGYTVYRAERLPSLYWAGSPS